MCGLGSSNARQRHSQANRTGSRRESVLAVQRAVQHGRLVKAKPGPSMGPSMGEPDPGPALGSTQCPSCWCRMITWPHPVGVGFESRACGPHSTGHHLITDPERPILLYGPPNCGSLTKPIRHTLRALYGRTWGTFPTLRATLYGLQSTASSLQALRCWRMGHVPHGSHAAWVTCRMGLVPHSADWVTCRMASKRRPARVAWRETSCR
jgi:hypothetical protein